MPKWKSLFNTFLGLLKIWSLHFFRNLSLCPTPPFWSPTILNCHRHHHHPHCHPHHRRLAQCQRPEIHIPSFGSTPCPCWWVWCPSWWVTNDALIWNVVLVTLDPPTPHTHPHHHRLLSFGIFVFLEFLLRLNVWERDNMELWIFSTK